MCVVYTLSLYINENRNITPGMFLISLSSLRRVKTNKKPLPRE